MAAVALSRKKYREFVLQAPDEYPKSTMGAATELRSRVWALIRRKMRLEGPLKLLLAFGRCFPG